MAHALDPETTAVLVMDLQSGILDMVPDAGVKEAVLSRTAELVARARRVGARIVYVGIGFRPGYPELPANDSLFASVVRSSGRFIEGTPSVAFHPSIAPEADDVRITKHRISAFAGTDLELVLRARRIESLVLAGVSTSGIVLSTLRHAADADYRIVVAEDCCADRDEEVHRVLMQKVFPRQASVTKSGELFVGPV